MAVEIHGVPVVVQASTEALVARLAERLAPWTVEHPDVAPEISVVESTSEDGRRTASSVHFRGRLVCTTHAIETALDVVERLLHVHDPAPAGTRWMRARALEHTGGVVLVGDALREALDGHHRRVARVGFADARTSPTLVDPLTGEALLPTGPPEAGAWRRVPMTAVVAFAPEDATDVSPAVRVTHATALVTGDDGLTTGADVQALVDLMSRVPFVPCGVMAPSDVIRWLERHAPALVAGGQSALSAARTSSS